MPRCSACNPPARPQNAPDRVKARKRVARMSNPQARARASFSRTASSTAPNGEARMRDSTTNAAITMQATT